MRRSASGPDALPVRGPDGIREEASEFADELAPLLESAYRLAVGMVLSSVMAEDTVQDAALRAWERRRNRRPGTDLGPWFLAIVANCCRETRRSRWLRVLRLAEPQSREAPAGPDMATRLDVRTALRGLPHGLRLALVLRFYLDLPFDQVARVLGCSTTAAKARVARGSARLRSELKVPEVLS